MCVPSCSCCSCFFVWSRSLHMDPWNETLAVQSPGAEMVQRDSGIKHPPVCNCECDLQNPQVLIQNQQAGSSGCPALEAESRRGSRCWFWHRGLQCSTPWSFSWISISSREWEQSRSWHYLVRGSLTQANGEEMLMVGGKMLKGSLIHLQDSFA